MPTVLVDIGYHGTLCDDVLHVSPGQFGTAVWKTEREKMWTFCFWKENITILTEYLSFKWNFVYKNVWKVVEPCEETERGKMWEFCFWKENVAIFNRSFASIQQSIKNIRIWSRVDDTFPKFTLYDTYPTPCHRHIQTWSSQTSPGPPHQVWRSWDVRPPRKGADRQTDRQTLQINI